MPKSITLDLQKVKQTQWKKGNNQENYKKTISRVKKDIISDQTKVQTEWKKR